MKCLVKILAVMLVLCILLTLLVACKKKGGNAEEDEGNGQGTTREDIKSSIEDNEDLDGENHDITDDTISASQFD